MYPKIFLKISLFLLLFCCNSDKAENGLPYYTSAKFDPIFIVNPKDITGKISHKVHEFTLVDQDQNVFNSKELHGKVHVVNFIFTTCGNICPVMTENLKSVVNDYHDSKRVFFVSFSVMPWVDTPERLKQYVVEKKIRSKNWRFLTGDKNEIYDLARKSYFVEEEFGLTVDESDFLHTEHMLLIDQKGYIRGIYNGTLLLDLKHLSKDIKVLLQSK